MLRTLQVFEFSYAEHGALQKINQKEKDERNDEATELVVNCFSFDVKGLTTVYFYV